MLDHEHGSHSLVGPAGQAAERRVRAGLRALLAGGVVASALLAAACHLVLPYTASTVDAAPTRAQDGALASDAGVIATADGWAVVDAGGDASAGGSGCRVGLAARPIDETMVACRVSGAAREVDQCHAASLCNEGRGWQLCAPLAYAQRFAARRPPVIGAWIGGCIYDLSARPYAFLVQGACPHCGDAELGTAVALARNCRTNGKDDDAKDSNTKAYRSAAKSVGFVSGAACATMLPSLAAGQTEAYWLPAAASEPRGAAFCCLQPEKR
ncbi:MAG: hypothetical protein IPL40_11475 [Proteobacteria bacterium]|nr:hypothetical protein [Pseudomonadota bacterium]